MPRTQKGKRHWDKHGGRATARAVYRNRARVQRAKGKGLQRKRGELIERSFAHVCETGQHRRVRLRGTKNVRKRYLIQAAAYNLSLLMRELLDAGTPREAVARCEAFLQLVRALVAWVASCANYRRPNLSPRELYSLLRLPPVGDRPRVLQRAARRETRRSARRDVAKSIARKLIGASRGS